MSCINTNALTVRNIKISLNFKPSVKLTSNYWSGKGETAREISTFCFLKKKAKLQRILRMSEI